MILRAGFCTACGTPIWRTAPHPVTGAPILLWPSPDSRYAVVPHRDGLVKGAGYCAQCHPENAIELESAGNRYGAWFTDQMGAFLARWIPEELKHDPAALLRLWAEDRQEAARG